MIRRPGHSVNAAAHPAETAAMPVVVGLDLELAAANVARFGGDERRFDSSLRAGLRAPGSLPSETQAVQDLAAVAAWRAGVIGLRTDALRALGSCLDHGLADAVAAVLGMPPTSVAEFAEAQRTDRFFWPAWRGLGRAYLIARIGGFTGLGGPWLAHPGEVIPAGEGRWLVEVGEELWEVTADLFGHSVSLAGDDAASDDTDTPGVRVVSIPTSYLLEVVREAA
ncbi:hypothetical protein J2S40_004629 [Nocardioides luteus]|uniref:Uncharacterized protein n=1 Tax=Nocardioides luteus TaxID=1844 RepID=A0ABQ5SYC3_9ACTN|nr:potassium transporter Kef [Nocardioides luteus]MDR7313571.1 hypothetical protein [Nocardioides luteus]GGR68936.1 hypothetical protein GCM10010197_40560 [Nocardioides luteus]GLJ69193.1 hypothetical protein GCM10017579_32290 [Nocardioides luteus]